MEEAHKKVGEIEAPKEYPALPLVEYNCNNNSNFTVVREGSPYCPLCGERLES